jgi:hypothetical protein
MTSSLLNPPRACRSGPKSYRDARDLSSCLLVLDILWIQPSSPPRHRHRGSLPRTVPRVYYQSIPLLSGGRGLTMGSSTFYAIFCCTSTVQSGTHWAIT